MQSYSLQNALCNIKTQTQAEISASSSVSSATFNVTIIVNEMKSWMFPSQHQISLMSWSNYRLDCASLKFSCYRKCQLFPFNHIIFNVIYSFQKFPSALPVYNWNETIRFENISQAWFLLLQSVYYKVYICTKIFSAVSFVLQIFVLQKSVEFQSWIFTWTVKLMQNLSRKFY